MRFKELKILAKKSEDAGTIETRARGAAERMEKPIKVISVDVHNRPTIGYNDRVEACVHIYDESENNNAEFEFGGYFVSIHGMPVIDSTSLDEHTLSFKKDADAVNDFIEQTLNTMESADEEAYPFNSRHEYHVE